MTRRERLEMVIANNITEELIEECKVELEKLNASNASRKPTAHQVENVKIGEDILALLSSEPKFVEDVLAGLDGELTRQRVSGILTNLVKDGKVHSEDVKVKGKGKRKVYTLA
jgi:hypothetical protein